MERVRIVINRHGKYENHVLEDSMSKKIIFHIDVNSAFLSWEAVHRMEDLGEKQDLRTLPAAVGGDISTRHGVILAKSTLAGACGVRTGEPIVSALRKCPGLILVPPDHELYEEKSKSFIEILRRYSEKVEQYSIDEAFADMTGTELLFGKPEQAAERMKEEIRDKLGFTVNIGISSNKLLAKMASDFEKPDKVHTLFPEEMEKKMWPLPVRDLFFVGGAAERKLNSVGIRTIGDLANTDVNILRSLLKKQGEVLWEFANGRDSSMVKNEAADSKGYGNSTTLPFDVSDSETAKQILLSLVENVGIRLRKDNVRIQVVSVVIRFHDFTKVSHQSVLDNATNITAEIYDAACRLFEETWDGTPIRLLGISTSKVSREEIRQMSLFDGRDYEKMEKLDKAMDSIREKFGADLVQRASNLSVKRDCKKR